LENCARGGSTALVTPQNWLLLGSYTALRERLLRIVTWDLVVKLGASAFKARILQRKTVVLTTAMNPDCPKSLENRADAVDENRADTLDNAQCGR
jgi:hypothetical protein